ncbi:MAG: hypothetical protein Ct9H300mP16_04280 [Pseudomonadota bacterium]|nr:MAG: hypothetical protein Ct9H300mP16_04280 [Pseudomonadota bacterium]
MNNGNSSPSLRQCCGWCPSVDSVFRTAAEKKSAKVECTPSEEKLVYDCMVMLSGKKSGDMIANAEFTVGADMPSMPMAHNVEPVAAHNAGNGMYHVQSLWRCTVSGRSNSSSPSLVAIWL